MKVSIKQIVEALLNTGGIVAPAADILGITRQSLGERIEKHQKLQDAKNEAKEIINDLAEGKYIKKINEGNLKAMNRWLDVHAKDRGWGKTVEQVHTGAVKYEVEIIDPSSSESES